MLYYIVAMNMYCVILINEANALYYNTHTGYNALSVAQ